MKSLLPVAHRVQLQLLNQHRRLLCTLGEVCFSTKKVNRLNMCPAEFTLPRLVFPHIKESELFLCTVETCFCALKVKTQRLSTQRVTRCSYQRIPLLFTGNCLQEALFLDILTSKELDNVSKLYIYSKQHWI